MFPLGFTIWDSINFSELSHKMKSHFKKNGRLSLSQKKGEELRERHGGEPAQPEPRTAETLGWMKEPKHKRILEARPYVNEDQSRHRKPEMEIREHWLLGWDWLESWHRQASGVTAVSWLGCGLHRGVLCPSHPFVPLRRRPFT